MGFTSRFNCKQNENHNFSRYLILDRITDSKIINWGSGIRMSWVDFFKTLINGEYIYSGLKSRWPKFALNAICISTYLQYSPKVLGHFALFVFCNELSSPSPPETMLVGNNGEVLAIMGKFRVHANFKCPTSEPTLF